MNDADMIEAMARTEAPDFIEGLQGFASMCERSLSIEDGPMLAAKFRDVAFCISIAKVELDRLRAENVQLRSALEPFASRADRYDPDDNDDGEPDWSTAAPSIRIGDLRRARAALEKSNG